MTNPPYLSLGMEDCVFLTKLINTYLQVDSIMTDFHAIRLASQLLSQSTVQSPADIVAHFGVIQAQHYEMAKWAIGMRLAPSAESSLDIIQQAIDQGQILRTHIMRPTWHFVTAEDIRWMAQLSKASIQRVIRDKKRLEALGLTENLFKRAIRLFEKHLAGNNGLTKEELDILFESEGIRLVTGTMYRLLMFAETEGVICSGADRVGKPTYALLDECVPSIAEISEDEAITRLARAYFRSHSPAQLTDFVWWSGLTTRQARQAIDNLEGELIREVYDGQTYYIYSSCLGRVIEPMRDRIHLLPAFDEYIIAYKDRDLIIPSQHQKACYTNGTFYPTILQHGRVVGLWSRKKNKSGVTVEAEYFEAEGARELNLSAPTKLYQIFYSR